MSKKKKGIRSFEPHKIDLMEAIRASHYRTQHDVKTYLNFKEKDDFNCFGVEVDLNDKKYVSLEITIYYFKQDELRPTKEFVCFERVRTKNPDRTLNIHDMWFCDKYTENAIFKPLRGAQNILSTRELIDLLQFVSNGCCYDIGTNFIEPGEVMGIEMKLSEIDSYTDGFKLDEDGSCAIKCRVGTNTYRSKKKVFKLLS